MKTETNTTVNEKPLDFDIANKLLDVLVKHDNRQKRSRSYNPYAFAQYCRALSKVEKHVENGSELRLALLNCFNGRLLDKLLKAANLPISTKAEQWVGGYEKLPEVDID